jgi:tetratricopeptide (TPR) repeat protein
MEDQSFFRLASNLLTSLLLMLPEDEILLRGRVIATQGRLARHVGDKAAANRWYGIVEQMGAEHQIPELTGRAWLGYGLLAYTRGDFPEARRQFKNVIELPGAASDSVAGAHHQLMAAAAAAKDYDTAAVHAWKAFEGASTPAQETDALLNLAQLLLDAGHARPALRGFAAALARNPIARLALPTLGGAACAAAAALEPARARVLVRNFASRVQELVTSLGEGAALPWPSASALVEISEALAAIGDGSEAKRVASRAEDLAHAHGFHQLTYRLENPVFVAQPVELAPATASILDAVDELEGAELVGAAP